MSNFRINQRNKIGLSVQDSISYNSINRELYRMLTNDEVLCANKTTSAESGKDYSITLGQDNIVYASIPLDYEYPGIYNELKSELAINLQTGGDNAVVITYKPNSGKSRQMVYNERGDIWIRIEEDSNNWGSWGIVASQSVSQLYVATSTSDLG